jgi:hypothetical protein
MKQGLLTLLADCACPARRALAAIPQVNQRRSAAPTHYRAVALADTDSRPPNAVLTSSRSGASIADRGAR